MPDNILDVCRFCLSSEGLLLPIFQNHISKNEIPFRDKVLSCTSIEIFADDDLPLKVCYICTHQIEKFFQFQAMCKNSDAVLHSQFSKTVVEQKILTETKYTPNLKQLENKSVVMQEYYSIDEPYSEQKIDVDVSTCYVCSTVFLSYNFLIDHFVKEHPDIESYFCKSCKASFPSLQEYKSHFNLQHSLMCGNCDCVFKCPKNFKAHLKTHINEYFFCKYCKKSFENIFELKKHEHIHAENTCSYCLKEITSKQDYEDHKKDCKQLYICKFCNQTMKFKKDLIDHINTCHDLSVPYHCNNCNKSFAKLTELQEHKCENLEGGDRGNDATNKPSILSDEQTNDILTCRFCTKKFSLRSSLKRHEKSHSGLKPYQCKFCPRKFKDSSACVVHTRTHTGEHPFRCQECDKDFKQLANLKMHTYRHHKKNHKSEEKSDIPNADNHNYEHLYSEEILDNYSSGNIREYQNITDSISTFNQSMNILISEQQ